MQSIQTFSFSSETSNRSLEFSQQSPQTNIYEYNSQNNIDTLVLSPPQKKFNQNNNCRDDFIDTSNDQIQITLDNTQSYINQQAMQTPKRAVLESPSEKQICSGLSVDFVKNLVEQSIIQNQDNIIINNQQYILIDCRWPYEYNGGTIQGSINIYNAQQIEKQLFQVKPKIQTTLIFYCEYSQVRSIKLSNYVYKLNKKYKFYFDIFIMSKGYHQFYQQYQYLTTTGFYISESDQQYVQLKEKYSDNGKYILGIPESI